METNDDEIGVVEADMGSEGELDFPEDWMVLDDVDEELIEVTSLKPSANDKKSTASNVESSKNMSQPIKRPNQAAVEKVSSATPSKQPATPVKSSTQDVQKQPVKSPASNALQMTKASAVLPPKPAPAKTSQPPAKAKSGDQSKTSTIVALEKDGEKVTSLKTEGSVTDFKTPPAKQAQQTVIKVGEGSQVSSVTSSDLQSASKASLHTNSEAPSNPSVLTKTALPNDVQGKSPNQTIVRAAAKPAVLSDDRKPVQTSQKQTPIQSSAKPSVTQKPLLTPQKSVQTSQKQTPVQPGAKSVVSPATQNPVQTSQKPVLASQKQTPVQSAAKPVVSPATQKPVQTPLKSLQTSQKQTPLQSAAKPAVSPGTQKPVLTPQKSVQMQQKQTPVQPAAKPVAEKPVQTPHKPAQIPAQPAAKSDVHKPVQTPQNPAFTPQTSAQTPQKPAQPGAKPALEKPVQTPQKPALTPQKSAQTPQKPAAENPVQTPQKPVQTPQKPVQTPQKPVQTPQKPVQTPQKQTPVQPAAKLTALSSALPNQKSCQPTQKPDQPSQKSVVTNQKNSQMPQSEIFSPPGMQKSVDLTVTQTKTDIQTASPVHVKLVITPPTMVTPVMKGAGLVKNGKQVSEKSTTAVLLSNTSEIEKNLGKTGTVSANYSKTEKENLTVFEPNAGKPDAGGLPNTLQQKDNVSANEKEKTNASNLGSAKTDQNKTDDKRDDGSSKNSAKSGLVGKEKAASTRELDKAVKTDERKDRAKIDKEKDNQSSVDRSNRSSRSYDRRRSRSRSRGRSRERSRYSRENRNSSLSRDRKRDEIKKSSGKDISASRKKESVSEKGVQTEENDALLTSIQQFDQSKSKAEPCNDMDMKQADKLFEIKSSELGLWRFALKIYPLEINDLSRQDLHNIINTAQDYAFIFRNQGLQKKKKGEARMFFNRLLTTKCFMQKLFQVELSTKKFQIEISRKLLDAEDKDTVVIDIDLTNPGLLTSATATSMTLSKGPAEEKIVHISNVPKSTTQELLFVVFPTAYSIQMPTDGKDKGTVVLQFRSGQCAEDVMTCYTGVLINKSRLKIARMASGVTRKEDVPEVNLNKSADAKKLEPSKKKSKTSLKIDQEKTADFTKQNNKSLDLGPVKVFTIPVLNQRVITTGTSTSAPSAVAGNRRKLSPSGDHQPEVKIPRMDQPPPFQPQSVPQSYSGFNPPINVPPPIATAAATSTGVRTISQKTSTIMPGTFPGFSMGPPGQPIMSSQTSGWAGSGQSVTMHQMDRSKMTIGMQQIGVSSHDWQMQQQMDNRCDVRGAENISPEWKEERPKFSLSEDISGSRDLDMKEREAERGRGAFRHQSFSPLGQHRNNSRSPARFGQVLRGGRSRSPRRPRSISPVGSVIAHRRSRSPMRQQHAKSRSPPRAGGQKSFSPKSHRRLSISPKNTRSLGRINASNSGRLSRSPGRYHSTPPRDLIRRSSQNLGHQESKNFTRNESHWNPSPLQQNLNSSRDKITDKEHGKMTKKERKEMPFGAQQKSFGAGRENMSLKQQNVAKGWFEGNPEKASVRQEQRNLSPKNQRSISQEHNRYISASEGISIQSRHNQDREVSPDLKIRVGPSGNRETYTRRSPSPRRVVELYTPQQPQMSGRSAGESRDTFSSQRCPDKERAGAEQFRGREQGWSGHNTHKAAAGPGSRALGYPSKTEENASTGSHYPSNATAASLDIPGLDLLIKAMTKDSGSAERSLMKLWPGSVDTGKGQAGDKDKQERESGWWREDSKSSPVFDKPGNRESFSRESQGLKTTRDLMTLRQEAAKHLANVEKTNLGTTKVLQTSRPSDVGLTMSSQQSMRPMSMSSDDVSTRDTFLSNVQIDSRNPLDNSSANPTGHFGWGSSNTSTLQQPNLERTSLDRRLANIQGFDRLSVQEPSWMGPNQMGMERKGFDQAVWPEGGGKSLTSGNSNWTPKNIVQDYGHGRSNQPRDDLGMVGANPGRTGLAQVMGLGGGDNRDLPRPGWGRGEARPGSLEREHAGNWPVAPGNMAPHGNLGDLGRGMGARENMGGTASFGGRGGFGMAGDLGGRGEMGVGGVSRDLGRPGNRSEPFGGSWLPPPPQPGPNQFMPYR